MAKATSEPAADPLPGAGGEEPVFHARDDQHGWFYHVAESYFYTANPWVRDWYSFIAEYRRVRLANLDPFPDTSSRATGHALGQVVQAYRVTGRADLLASFRDYLNTTLRPNQDPYYGDQKISVEPSGGGFQTGYLMRTIIDYLEEVREVDRQAYAEAFSYLSGLVEWNAHYGNFPYYFDARQGGVGASSGTGLSLVDPQAWYYWHTGKAGYLAQIETFLTAGVNGGEQPYGNFSQWAGQYEGRLYLYAKNTPRSDSTPPPAIADLAAAVEGDDVRLTWTAPLASSGGRYHIVWSARPIVEAPSPSPEVTNWWAANPIGPALDPAPGALQSLLIPGAGSSPVYTAVFTFDQADNMSAISNVAATAAPIWRSLFLPLVAH